MMRLSVRRSELRTIMKAHMSARSKLRRDGAAGIRLHTIPGSDGAEPPTLLIFFSLFIYK